MHSIDRLLIYQEGRRCGGYGSYRQVGSHCGGTMGNPGRIGKRDLTRL